MDDKFIFGVTLGMLGGAMLVANSQHINKAIQDGEQAVMQKVSKLTNAKSKKN